MECRINISIDDISPHPLSSVKVLDRCYELIEKFDDIKFTLFIPAAYWRTIGGSVDTTTPTALKISDYPEFCEAISKLPEKHFELGYHGYFHGIPQKSNNDEFQSINYDDANEKFDLIFETVEAAGLKDKFKPYFRPPAWRMSPDSFKAAADRGIELFALSSKPYALNTYQGYDNECDKVVYYNCNPPFDPLYPFEKTEVVYHACEWDKNYFSLDKKEQLEKFIVSYKERIEFCFLEELLD